MLGTELDTLEAKGLIRLAAARPELEYLFRHWLVQDAAYGSLLKQERRELHRLVGDALESLYPDRLAELAGVLALHYEQAGETDRAIEYLTAAGRYALDRNAIVEAFDAFDRAQRLLPSPSDTEDDELRRRRLDVGLGRTRASFSFRPADDLIADLEALAPVAERLGDLSVIARLHTDLAMIRLQDGLQATDPDVQRSLGRVAEIGEALEDPSLRALPLAMVGMNEVFLGPVDKGVAQLEEAIPLLERHADSVGAAFARGALAMGYARLGQFDRAKEAARNATEIAAKSDLIAQLDALISESAVRSLHGDLEAARPIAMQCVQRAEETGSTACVVASSFILGDVLQRQGRLAEARETLGRGRELADVVERKTWRPSLQAWLATTDVALGTDAPPEAWEEALATARSISNVYGEAGILAKRGEAHALRGDHAAACADLEASARIYEGFGARPDLARVLHRLGMSQQSCGRAADAEATLRRSLALFEEMGIAGEAMLVRGELAAVAGIGQVAGAS
jgi:tetratricopeptide (TPR) repeat protein